MTITSLKMANFMVEQLQAENAALKAELAAAQDDLAALRLFAANLDATHNATLKEMQITMRQELAAAKKDAERLAFVESRAYVGVNPHTKTCLWVLRGIYELPGQCFRAAIDKAMEGDQK